MASNGSRQRGHGSGKHECSEEAMGGTVIYPVGAGGWNQTSSVRWRVPIPPVMALAKASLKVGEIQQSAGRGPGPCGRI
jgi:hypothetical protein